MEWPQFRIYRETKVEKETKKKINATRKVILIDFHLNDYTLIPRNKIRREKRADMFSLFKNELKQDYL